MIPLDGKVVTGRSGPGSSFADSPLMLAGLQLFLQQLGNTLGRELKEENWDWPKALGDTSTGFFRELPFPSAEIPLSWVGAARDVAEEGIPNNYRKLKDFMTEKAPGGTVPPMLRDYWKYFSR